MQALYLIYVLYYLEWESNFFIVSPLKNRHHNALTYATKAVEILSNESISQNNTEQPAQNELKYDDSKTSTLGIAYYNMGVELEYLKNFSGCIDAYKKGISELEKRNFAKTNPIYQNLLKSFTDASQKHQQRIDFHTMRSRTRSLHATKLIFAKKPEIKQNEIKISNLIKNEVICESNAISAFNTTKRNKFLNKTFCIFVITKNDRYATK